MTEREDLVERVARAIRVVNISSSGVPAYLGDFDVLKTMARAAIAECEKDRSEDYEQLLGAYRRLEAQAAAMRVALEFAEKQYRGFALDYGTVDCEAYNRMKDALPPRRRAEGAGCGEGIFRPVRRRARAIQDTTK